MTVIQYKGTEAKRRGWITPKKSILILQVSEFLNTKRKTTLGQEELAPMVSVRIGELNKLCRKKGIEIIQQSKVRKTVAKLGIGKWRGSNSKSIVITRIEFWL